MAKHGARAKSGVFKNLDKTNPGCLVNTNEIPCLEWLDYQIDETEAMLQQMYKLREEVWK